MFFKCPECDELFSRKSNLVRHQREIHQGQTIKKYSCSLTKDHKDCSYNLPRVTVNGITRIIAKHAFGDVIRNIRFYTDQSFISIDFMKVAKPLIQETLDILKSEKRPLKLQSTLCVVFEKIADATIKDEAFFSITATTLDNYNLDDVIQTMEIKIQNYTTRGSNWKISDTRFFELNTTVFK